VEDLVAVSAPVVRVRAARASDRDVIAGFNAAMAIETEGRSLDREVLGCGVERALGDPSRRRAGVSTAKFSGAA
jgi:hypothetical protein